MALTRDDVVSQMTPVFKAASMRRRRFWWYWSSEEIAWAFRVEKLPYGNRIGMDLMCAPLVSGFETPATLKGDDYPLVIFSPDWNVDPNVNTQMLEDLGCAQLDDERRRELLTRFACMLVDYLHSHSTAEALVRAYAAGEYRSSFLRKELQWAFDREVVRLGLGDKGATSSCP